MCSGKAEHLFFVESRLKNFEIRNRVRTYMLTDSGTQGKPKLGIFAYYMHSLRKLCIWNFISAANLEVMFIIGQDPESSAADVEKLEKEINKYGDIIQISTDETLFSFTTQGICL